MRRSQNTFRFLSLLTLALGTTFASPITIDYTLNMGPGGSNKTDVTSIAVFQSNGSQLDLSFIPSIPGIGTSVVSVNAPFTPTFSLLIGISEPADSTGRRHLIAFVNDTFLDTYAGLRFSGIFVGYGERAFAAPLISAAAGNVDDQNWLKTFYTTQGYKAAFASNTVPVGVEFTPPTALIIPEPATYSLAGVALLAFAAARRKR